MLTEGPMADSQVNSVRLDAYRSVQEANKAAKAGPTGPWDPRWSRPTASAAPAPRVLDKNIDKKKKHRDDVDVER